ncbi:MAG TPA: response regulator [Vicinamibacterales bacterium]
MQADYVWRGSIPVPSTDAQPRRPVVLVVTGDSDLRAATARAFEREGYTVLTAAHAGHAVLACMKAGRIDLLASELSMDDVSGPALAARLRRFSPSLATVFFAPPGGAECEGVLVKPFSQLDLLAASAVARAGAIMAPRSFATSAS